MTMTSIEKLIDQQLANTKHAKRGGSFNRLNGRRLPRPTKTKIDENGLYRLDYPSKRRA